LIGSIPGRIIDGIAEQAAVDQQMNKRAKMESGYGEHDELLIFEWATAADYSKCFAP
jgi:hypothetical protein